jgi:hypothetical protein
MNLNHILNQVGKARAAAGNLFSISCFLNLHGIWAKTINTKLPLSNPIMRQSEKENFPPKLISLTLFYSQTISLWTENKTSKWVQKWFLKVLKIFCWFFVDVSLGILAHFGHILWILITFWKKFVEGGPTTYFKFDIFWIYMLWGIQNQ